jgi:hypothetical protein
MGRAAGAGDDDLVAGAPGALRKSDQPVGRAVSGDDAVVVADAKNERRSMSSVAQSDWSSECNGMVLSTMRRVGFGVKEARL